MPPFFYGRRLCLTIEEQKYVEECKKKLSQEQVKIVQMAFEYGLSITDIRKLAIPKLRPEQMQQIVYAMMEEIDEEVLEQICKGDFDQYQIQEIVSGFSGGLGKEEVMSYAVQDLPANRMKKMRTHLLDAKKSTNTDTGMKEYTDKLMQLMDTSLQQFQKNNEKFELLSGLVKDHVFEAKDQEIKDLYENIKNKDVLIRQLQKEIEEKNQLIESLHDNTITKVVPEAAEKREVGEQSNTTRLQSLDTYNEEIPKRKSILSLLSKNKKKDILDQIAGEGLSPQQLEEIRSSFDSGLPDVQVMRLIRKDLSPEKMRKMKEIMLLIQKRRLAEDVCAK